MRFYKSRAHRILIRVLLAAVILFIFSNSLENAADSSSKSGFFTALLNHLLGLDLSEHMVRKAAHFCEYAAEGFLFVPAVSNPARRRFVPLPACFLTACIDENLQRFSQGRCPSFTDVCIDTSGAACGILLMLLIVAAIRWLKNRPGFNKM